MRVRWSLPLKATGIDVETGDTTLRIRPVRPEDRDGLYKAFERFSSESRYQRFFSGMERLPEHIATALTDFEPDTQLAWGVFDPTVPSEVDDGSGLAVAAARLFLDAGANTAEATFAVADDYQRRGLGSFLFDLLVATATFQELDQIRFEVLSGNRPMRELLKRRGLSGSSRSDDRTVVQFVMEVPSPAEVDPTIGALYHLLLLVADGGDRFDNAS